MALPRPGDPFVTRQGKILSGKEEGKELSTMPRDGGDDIIASAGIAKKHIPSMRRSITELPASDAKTQTAIVVVLFYALFGLTDNEIAATVGIGIPDVKKLKSLDAYQETYDLLFWEMIHANGQSMVARIAKFAPTALNSIMEVAEKGENENAKYKAAADILDRSGLNHEHLFGKTSNDDMGSLKIVIKSEDEDKTEVKINLRR